MNLTNLEEIFGKQPKKYVIADFSQLAIATASQVFEPQEPITLGMLRHLVLDTIRANILRFKKQGYDEFILAIDNPNGGGYWRRDLANYYKKSRTKSRSESDWDWDGYFENIRVILDEIKENMPYTVINIDRIEADDVIATLTKRFSLNGDEIMIVSSDGDFTQLHKFKNVKQWSPMHKKLVKPKNGSAKADLMYKLIKGDKKDTIAPINVRSDYWITKLDGERCPPTKTIFVEACIDAEDPLSLMDDQQIERFKENKKLIDFDEIPSNISEQILNEYDNYVKNSKTKIYPYFVKSGLTKLMSEVNSF